MHDAASAQPPSSGRRFDSGGVQIAYLVEGEGPPIVLVHGLAINSEVNWRGPGWIERLTRTGRSVIALDLRGHGRSDRPHHAAAYDAAIYEDVIRLLDHLGIERAEFMGYSLGAWVGLGVLASHPDRLECCVLGGCGKQGFDRGTDLFLADAIEGISCEDPARKGEAEMMLGLVSLFGNDRKALAALLRSGWFASISLDRLARNTRPVLLISGANDHLVPDPEDMRRRIGCSTAVVVPDANHMTVLRHPRFQEAVLAFLAEHGLRGD